MHRYHEYNNSSRNYIYRCNTYDFVLSKLLHCCTLDKQYDRRRRQAFAERSQNIIDTPRIERADRITFFPLVQHRETYITVPGTALSPKGNVTKVPLSPYRNGIILIRHRKRMSTIAIFSPRYSVALTRVTHVGMRYIAQNMIIEGSPTRMTHQRK